MTAESITKFINEYQPIFYRLKIEGIPIHPNYLKMLVLRTLPLSIEDICIYLGISRSEYKLRNRRLNRFCEKLPIKKVEEIVLSFNLEAESEVYDA